MTSQCIAMLLSAFSAVPGHEDGLVGKKFLSASANAHAFTCEHDYQTWWEILKLVLKAKLYWSLNWICEILLFNCSKILNLPAFQTYFHLREQKKTNYLKIEFITNIKTILASFIQFCLEQSWFSILSFELNFTTNIVNFLMAIVRILFINLGCNQHKMFRSLFSVIYWPFQSQITETERGYPESE